MAYTFQVVGNQYSPGPSSINSTATTVAAAATVSAVWAQIAQYVDRLATVGETSGGATVPDAARLVELFNEMDSLFFVLAGISPGTFT